MQHTSSSKGLKIIDRGTAYKLAEQLKNYRLANGITDVTLDCYEVIDTLDMHVRSNAIYDRRLTINNAI